MGKSICGLAASVVLAVLLLSVGTRADSPQSHEGTLTATTPCGGHCVHSAEPFVQCRTSPLDDPEPDPDPPPEPDPDPEPDPEPDPHPGSGGCTCPPVTLDVSLYEHEVTSGNKRETGLELHCRSTITGGCPHGSYTYTVEYQVERKDPGDPEAEWVAVPGEKASGSAGWGKDAKPQRGDAIPSTFVTRVYLYDAWFMADQEDGYEGWAKRVSAKLVVTDHSGCGDFCDYNESPAAYLTESTTEDPTPE